MVPRAMTEPERDALYARVFATPDGKLVIEDLRRRYKFLAWAIDLRLSRMRERWATGAPR